MIKAELHDSEEVLFNRKLNRLRQMTDQVTEDNPDGHAAWREKRAPQFMGGRFDGDRAKMRR